jgi:acetyl-CoA carboxylase carboxyltransferase component
VAPTARDVQRYPRLPDTLVRGSAEALARRAANLVALDKLARAHVEATAGGGDKYVQRHLAAGKLLPRERIELLLDRDARSSSCARWPARHGAASPPAPA